MVIKSASEPFHRLPRRTSAQEHTDARVQEGMGWRIGAQIFHLFQLA